ncbi:MAG: hypothetical protein ACRDFZ_00415 [Candidatus Limnocylindria bacterium]
MGTDETLDAYVFVGSGNESAFTKLKGLKGDIVRYATPLLSGSYGALAFVEVSDPDGLAELEQKLWRIRDAVNPPSTDTAIKIAQGARAPTRWSDKPPIAAFVRIRVEAGRARDVLDATAGFRNYWGSAIVAGSFDILLELGGQSYRELTGALLEELHTVSGITWTDTAFALNRPKETWAE